jgi:hypothetical protein
MFREIAMSDAGMVGAGLVAVFATLCLRQLMRRDSASSEFADEREEKLTLRLARMVGCSTGRALDAIRREMKIAPDATDDAILKRAAYHYSRDIPERECPVFRDRAAG